MKNFNKYLEEKEAEAKLIEAKKEKWIQKADLDTSKPCTGKKFGGPTCPKGSRKYNLAVTFKKMGKKKKNK